MLVSTVSCDAAILRCDHCKIVSIADATATIGTCTCGGELTLDRKCPQFFSLNKDDDNLLIRCVAENKEGWRCEDRGDRRRDFCAKHAGLANPARARHPREYEELIKDPIRAC